MNLLAQMRQIKRKAADLNQRKVESFLFQIVRGIEDELARLNVEQIREESRSINNNPIGFYSFATELITKGRKKQGEPFDLEDTGVFLKGVFARAEPEGVFFDTTDPKKLEVLDNLLDKEIFGLTDENLNNVLETKVKEKLGEALTLYLFS